MRREFPGSIHSSLDLHFQQHEQKLDGCLYIFGRSILSCSQRLVSHLSLVVLSNSYIYYYYTCFIHLIAVHFCGVFVVEVELLGTIQIFVDLNDLEKRLNQGVNCGLSEILPIDIQNFISHVQIFINIFLCRSLCINALFVQRIKLLL